MKDDISLVAAQNIALHAVSTSTYWQLPINDYKWNVCLQIVFLCFTITIIIGHLHAGTILQPRQTRMLYQNAFLFKFVFFLGNKETIEKN